MKRGQYRDPLPVPGGEFKKNGILPVMVGLAKFHDIVGFKRK